MNGMLWYLTDLENALQVLAGVRIIEHSSLKKYKLYVLHNFTDLDYRSAIGQWRHPHSFSPTSRHLRDALLQAPTQRHRRDSHPQPPNYAWAPKAWLAVHSKNRRVDVRAPRNGTQVQVSGAHGAAKPPRSFHAYAASYSPAPALHSRWRESTHRLRRPLRRRCRTRWLGMRCRQPQPQLSTQESFQLAHAWDSGWIVMRWRPLLLIFPLP